MKKISRILIAIMVLGNVFLVHSKVFAQRSRASYDTYDHSYIPETNGKPDFMIDTINMTNNKFRFSLKKSQALDKKPVEIGVIWIISPSRFNENLDPIYIYTSDYNWSIAAFSRKYRPLEEGVTVGDRLVWDLDASSDLQLSIENRVNIRTYEYFFFIRFNNNLMWNSKIDFKTCVDEMNAGGLWRMGMECRAESWDVSKNFSNVTYKSYPTKKEKDYLAEIDQKNQEIKRLREEISMYMRERNELLKETGDLRTKINRLENKIKEYEKIIASLGEDKLKLETEIEKYGYEMNILTNEKQDLKFKLDEHIKKMSELEKNEKELLKKIEGLELQKKEYESLVTRSKEDLAEFEKLKEEISSLNKQILENIQVGIDSKKQLENISSNMKPITYNTYNLSKTYNNQDTDKSNIHKNSKDNENNIVSKKDDSIEVPSLGCQIEDRRNDWWIWFLLGAAVTIGIDFGARKLMRIKNQNKE